MCAHACMRERECVCATAFGNTRNSIDVEGEFERVPFRKVDTASS
jgi:predicted GTPase